jgi:hypothetical protein
MVAWPYESYCRPDIFHKRWFEPTIIVTCVRWYHLWFSETRSERPASGWTVFRSSTRRLTGTAESGYPCAVQERLLFGYVSAIGGAASERQPSMNRQ